MLWSRLLIKKYVRCTRNNTAQRGLPSRRTGAGGGTRGHAPFTGCVVARRQTVEVQQSDCGGVDVERSKKLEESLEVRIPAPGKVPMIPAMKQE
jgi:hypothetical protein